MSCPPSAGSLTAIPAQQESTLGEVRLIPPSIGRLPDTEEKDMELAEDSGEEVDFEDEDPVEVSDVKEPSKPPVSKGTLERVSIATIMQHKLRQHSSKGGLQNSAHLLTRLAKRRSGPR